MVLTKDEKFVNAVKEDFAYYDKSEDDCVNLADENQCGGDGCTK